MLKVRARKFAGRCKRHKRYNPAVDGRGGIKGNCGKCNALAEIYDAALNLNTAIRRFDATYDDLEKPKPAGDPRQMELI